MNNVQHRKLLRMAIDAYLKEHPDVEVTMIGTPAGGCVVVDVNTKLEPDEWWRDELAIPEILASNMTPSGEAEFFMSNLLSQLDAMVGKLSEKVHPNMLRKHTPAILAGVNRLSGYPANTVFATGETDDTPILIISHEVDGVVHGRRFIEIDTDLVNALTKTTKLTKMYKDQLYQYAVSLREAKFPHN